MISTLSMKFSFLAHRAVSLLMLGLSGACGIAEDITGMGQVQFGGTCNIKEDQMGSFMAKIGVFPRVVKVIADEHFTEREFDELRNAVYVWNQMGSKVAHHSFFELHRGSVPSGVRAADPRDCSKEYSSESFFYVVKVTSESDWSALGFTDSIPGVTIRCSGGKSRLDQQIVFLNPSPQIIHEAQFQSVVIHELGHSLGLDHSCINEQGRPDYASCMGLEEDHPYRKAVMYPSLVKTQNEFSSQIKDVLRENDFLRTQCLYSP